MTRTSQKYSGEASRPFVGNRIFGIFKALAALRLETKKTIDVFRAASIAAGSRAYILFADGIADADEHCRCSKPVLVANDSR